MSAASPPSPIHGVILVEFTKVFGRADRVVGKDMHWSLRPKADEPAINVLVNGSAQDAVIWVFDPHSKHDGVHSEIVKDDAAVARLIKMIQARMKAAGDGDGDGRKS